MVTRRQEADPCNNQEDTLQKRKKKTDNTKDNKADATDVDENLLHQTPGAPRHWMRSLFHFFDGHKDSRDLSV